MRDGTIRGRAAAEGDDVTALLDLVKYEPPIPIAMQGEVRPAHGATLHYDIENFKKYPDALRPGEPVVITEKLHGSWCCLGRYPDHGPVVTSKGMSDRGLALELDEANRNNLYVRAWRSHEVAFERALLRSHQHAEMRRTKEARGQWTTGRPPRSAVSYRETGRRYALPCP